MTERQDANPQPSPQRLHSQLKAIIVGAAAGGIMSVIPLLNLLNLLLMFWMGLGGFVCVYILVGANRRVKRTDAMLFGALAGGLGCLFFGAVTYLLLSVISIPKVERILILLERFWPELGSHRDIVEFLQSPRLIVFFALIMAILLLISLVAGALGGLIAGKVCQEKENQGDGHG